MSFGSGGFGSESYGSGPGSAPLISAWLPFLGAELRRLDSLQFDVTDENVDLLAVTIRAIFLGGASEVAWNGAEFSAAYRRGSARQHIPGGQRFTLRRTSGWPSAVLRLEVIAEDLAGNIAVGQALYL